MRGSPLSRLLWPVSVISLPALVVFAVLVAIGGLDLTHAVIGAAAVVLGAGALADKFFGDIDAVRGYVDRLHEKAAPAPPQLALSGPLEDVVASLDRFHQGIAALTRGGETGGGALPDGDGSGLDALLDPLLMLDGERRVVRANHTAHQMFGVNLIGRDLASVIRNPALLQATDQVMAGEPGAEVEFPFFDPVERNFSARIARMPSAAGDGALIVIVLYDITAVKRAEEMRSDFVANVSHELRTPVSVLLGCIQTLRGPARDDPEAQAEFFGLMQSQAERMSRLVDDLLSLTRIEMNEHTIPSEAIDLGLIIGQVVESLGFNASARSIRIATDFSDRLPVIAGDGDELTQLFQNLIDNAVKYGGENSTVQVTAGLASEVPPSLPSEGDFIAVAIRDQGEGIPPEHLPRLTERFYRVDTARSRELGGTGLGLAIVKHIASRHRGALAIDSTLGEGSVFTVYLPAAPPDRAP